MNTFTHQTNDINLIVVYDEDYNCQIIHLETDQSNTNIYDILESNITKSIEDKLLEMYTESNIEKRLSWNGLDWE
jgi:hypothetical protein